MKVLPGKYVFKIKENKPKVRLVALGCRQSYGIDYKETFAPVVTLTTVRTILAVEGRTGWEGCVRGGEDRRFTSLAKLDLFRLNNHTTLSAQREDELRNRECAAASTLPPQQDYRVWRLHTRQHSRLMTVHCSSLWIADKTLYRDNRTTISEDADSNCFQVGKCKRKLFLV